MSAPRDGVDAVRRERAATGRLARRIALALGALLVVALGAGSAVAGASGAAGAAVGVGLAGVLFGGGLLGLRRPATGGASLTPVVAALGLRLVLYAAALALVTRAGWVHGPSLASATAASIAVILAVVLVALSREPVPELEPSDPPGPGGGGTTSDRRRPE